MATSSLYERIGGRDAITAAVGIFYQKIMNDPLVAPFFDGYEMPRQIKKQIAFMTMAFGGPHGYTGRDLRTAHAPLVARGLGEVHFNAIAGHLDATLHELGVAQALIDEAMTIVGGTKADVLNH
ncbi:group 1 truncated hemoglobin [Pseudenhygromyxa sp. WMMC2535]|uniref:group I truncated hemoglobin n=1 Tax=Pseudenhygromyxa sp. WMMC2535 TaxID=2712867 RepID=UPI0015580421|nr:group 1 truncated hemoglobin [Pseudenhygromyxa sp. WMMC2535]NVB39936.1 group 1 truncated hemoglobin [Pseudenhygromyxa sp. WMMC2535]